MPYNKSGLLTRLTPRVFNNLEKYLIEDRYLDRSADRGDANVTLTTNDAEVQVFATALTANRTITLPASATRGAHFRILRTGGGAFTLAVGSVITMPATVRGFVDVVYDGSAWQLAAMGSMA